MHEGAGVFVIGMGGAFQDVGERNVMADLTEQQLMATAEALIIVLIYGLVRLRH